MKYIITESKLDETITNYLDELFNIDDINWTHPLDYDLETGEEWDDVNRVVFYMGVFIGTNVITLIQEVLLEISVQWLVFSMNMNIS
jgi:hypothetical protein